MMSSVFYGEIKEDRLNTWKENKNPYDILADNNRIERLGGWDFLFIADELFTDCVQVDWGSFAYKCTKEQLIELTRKTKCAISGIELLKPEKIYGILSRFSDSESDSESIVWYITFARAKSKEKQLIVEQKNKAKALKAQISGI